MNIHWLLPLKFENTAQLGQCTMASARLRAGAVWHALKNTSDNLTVGNTIPPNTDICIIGKIGGKDTELESKKWLKQLINFNGIKILDYTDDILLHQNIMTPFYADCIPLVQHVVCSSNWLKNSIRKHFSGSITVITDAIEVPILAPKYEIHEPLRLLWFGHASNIQALADFLPTIEYMKPLQLKILSNEQGFNVFMRSLKKSGTDIKISFGIWSPQEMIKASKSCDACIIPIDQMSTRKSGVSSNRLITALMLGLPTAADIPESYSEFSEYFTKLRSDCFYEFLENPKITHKKILEFQKNKFQEFTQNSIGSTWLSLFSDLKKIQ